MVRRHASGGTIYIVMLAPREGSAGVEGWAIVFIDQTTGAVLSTRTPTDVDLQWTTGSELDVYLARAQ